MKRRRITTDEIKTYGHLIETETITDTIDNIIEYMDNIKMSKQTKKKLMEHLNECKEFNDIGYEDIVNQWNEYATKGLDKVVKEKKKYLDKQLDKSLNTVRENRPQEVTDIINNLFDGDALGWYKDVLKLYRDNNTEIIYEIDGFEQWMEAQDRVRKAHENGEIITKESLLKETEEITDRMIAKVSEKYKSKDNLSTKEWGRWHYSISHDEGFFVSSYNHEELLDFANNIHEDDREFIRLSCLLEVLRYLAGVRDINLTIVKELT